MTVVFKITDGTTTVDFFGGPFYLSSWRPAIAKYKNSGIFLDSPLSTGRTLAHRIFQNATERIDLKMRAASDNDAAFYTNKLMDLAEKAAEHHITGGTFDPVWIEVKSKNETNTRYAIVQKAELTDLENPFSQPFRQTDCSAVMDNLSFIVERGEWTGAPPGEASTLEVTEGVPDYNMIVYGSFEHDALTYAPRWWSEYNSPSTNEVVNSRAYDGAKSVHIVGTSGAYKGISREVTAGLTTGVEYEIKARCLAESGAGSLVAYDGGGYANPVTDDTIPRSAEILSNTSFETDLSGWGDSFSTATATRSNTYAYNGTTWSLKLDTPAWTWPNTIDRYHSEHIALPSGITALNFSFAGLRATAAPTNLRVRIQFWTSDWRGISTTDSPLYFEMPTSGDWYYFQRKLIVPVGTAFDGDPPAAYAKIEFQWDKLYSTGPFTLHFDEFELFAVLPDINESLEWQELSVTKAAAAGGIRVGLATKTTTGGDVYFDKVEFNRVYAPTGSEADTAFFANTCFNYNLTHIYTKDAAVFSENLLDSSLPYALLPAVIADDDAIYFGSLYGPFASIAFDLESIIDDPSVSVLWEYYDASGGDGYTPLSVRDKTDAFQNIGKNVVTWYGESDWVRNTENSEYAYWVRATLAVGTPLSTAVQKNTHPHIVAQSHFELDSAQLAGQLRSLMKYTITNESGPSTISVVEAIATGNDDVFADDDSGTETLTLVGSTADFSLDTTIGLRFQSIVIPNRTAIVSAKLFCKPNTATTTAWQNLDMFGFQINGEDADDSAAFSDWANFSGRDRTAAYTTGLLETANFIEHAADRYSPPGFDSLSHVIQEIVNRPGWASGNDMTLFITDLSWPTIGASEYARFDMYENDANAWILEIEYMSEARYTSSIYFGARSTSRGEDFQAWINTNSNYQIPGIDIGGGDYIAMLQATAFEGSVIPHGECTVILSSHLDESYDDRVIFYISPPLAEQYEGRYRAFIRAALDTPDTEVAKVRLRTQIGSGGSSFTNETSLLQVGNPALIDMGPVTIPRVGGADVIQLAVQTLTEDVISIYIFGICLIPIDEWYLEATQPSGSVTQLDSETYLEVNSTNSSPDTIIASIKDKGSTATRANMLIAGSQASLAAGRTQRVWVATASDLRSYEDITTVPKGLYFTRGSHTDIVHEVSAEGVLRYLGMRGAA